MGAGSAAPDNREKDFIMPLEKIETIDMKQLDIVERGQGRAVAAYSPARGQYGVALLAATGTDDEGLFIAEHDLPHAIQTALVDPIWATLIAYAASRIPLLRSARRREGN
jgi:hypothetical protein